jgi:hypothetical protein
MARLNSLAASLAAGASEKMPTAASGWATIQYGVRGFRGCPSLATPVWTCEAGELGGEARGQGVHVSGVGEQWHQANFQNVF